MRILSIGLGGAGCRIVNSLYATDRRSSKILCVQALAIDVDSDTLFQLESLPENAKLFFPPIDPDLHPEGEGKTLTATIDIGEIVSRIQNFESGETDAIFVCSGLGGSMVDVAPHIIASLRSSTAEPIFGLVTLPCLAEGERRSAKAADDLEMLSPLLDGIILFDNETWYKKIKAHRSTLVKKEKGLAEKLGFRRNDPDISPELATYLLLNEAIVRRISLILRAGEFKADGGLDLAEVVLDSGEVLNTMKGMGYITIGYAVEHLPHHPLSFLTSWHPTGLFHDSHKIKASRIVDLAKQAIYHEISTPCDMTSAHKALILIAGPSHELSMKGFMTVRKWIDRSIAGLETRSGDYPVMNTKNVAIIIMLSGLENIPRITELREIQNQYKSGHKDGFSIQSQSDSDGISAPESIGIIDEDSGVLPSQGGKIFKDEMIVLPVKSHKGQIKDTLESGNFGLDEEDHPAGYNESQHLPRNDSSNHKTFSDPTNAEGGDHHPDTPEPHPPGRSTPQIHAEADGKRKIEEPPASRHRVIAQDDDHISQSGYPQQSRATPAQGLPRNKKSTYNTDRISDEKKLPHKGDGRIRTKEIERQIIERELQRQRANAVQGHKLVPGESLQTPPVYPSEVIRLKREISKKTTRNDDSERFEPAEVPPTLQDRKKVIIHKRRVHAEIQKPQVPARENTGFSGNNNSVITRSEVLSSQVDSEKRKIDSKNLTNTSKDHIFVGRGVQRSDRPHVRDTTLIHTDLKTKKKSIESKSKDDGESTGQLTEAFKSPGNQGKNTKKDDISWI